MLRILLLLVSLDLMTVRSEWTSSSFEMLSRYQSPMRSQTVVQKQKNVVIQCPKASLGGHRSDEGLLIWTLNGNVLRDTTRRYRKGKSLVIDTVFAQLDGGIYACWNQQDYSPGDSPSEKSVLLHVIWIEDETRVQLVHPEKKKIDAGDEVHLRCLVHGAGDMTYDWFRNGQHISNDKMKIDRSELRINKVTSEQNGAYTCSAQNTAGFAQTFSSSFILSVKGVNVPALIVAPKAQTGKIGGSVKFDCAYEKNALVEWYFNGNGPLKNSERYEILLNGSLVIENLMEKDQGTYKCLGRFSTSLDEDNNNVQIYSAVLRIAYLEALQSESSFHPNPVNKAVGVKAHTTVEIICETPMGFPRPRLRWKDPSGNFIIGKKMYTESREELFSQLLIENIASSDGGNYTCVADNTSDQSTSATIPIVVTKPPTIIGHPLSTIAEEGEKVVFMCQFKGTPYPVSIIRWLRDGSVVATSENYSQSSNKSERNESNDDNGSRRNQMDERMRREHHGNRFRNHHHHHNHHQHHGVHPSFDDRDRFQTFPLNGTLKILRVMLPDAGNYSCEIITPGFSPVKSNTAELFVTESLEFNPKPIDRKLELGSSAKIHCKAKGFPLPFVKWVKNGQQGALLSWPSHVMDTNGTLNFKRVDEKDTGSYTCVATSSQGIINATIFVDVIVSPKFATVSKNPVEAVEGESIMMHCEAYGDPKPTIQWDKNKNLNDFDPTRFQILDNGTLIVMDVQRDDDGQYGCTAGNSGGFKRKEITLVVKGPTEEGVMTKTVAITLSVAAGYMLLVITLMLWCRYRQLKRKQAYIEEIEKANGDAELRETAVTVHSNGHGPLHPAKVNGISQTDSSRQVVRSDGETAKSTHSSLNGKPGSVSSHRSHQSKRSGGSSMYEKVAFPREDLQFVMLLGNGEFGEVFLAKATIEQEEKLVMVKSLQTREENALLEFKRELEMYYKLSHQNVCQLLKLCREMEPHYLITDYSDWGDLKQYLLATRKDNPRNLPKPPPLNLSQFMKISLQVASGMEHLSNSRFTHKDLACRNCLISSGLRIQIASPCLTKDTYSMEYAVYRNQVLPVRWQPSEAIVEDDFSTKSDVWSFGCLMWEVLHQASIPFPGKSNEQLITALESNHAIWDASVDLNEAIILVPAKIRSLLALCWDPLPKNRPSFTSIVNELHEISQEEHAI